MSSQGRAQFMSSTAARPTGRCGHRSFQPVRTTAPQLGGRHLLHVAHLRVQKYCGRVLCTVAAAVPVAGAPVPKTSLLFAAVEKLFNFPPIYAAAVRQVSKLARFLCMSIGLLWQFRLCFACTQAQTYAWSASPSAIDLVLHAAVAQKNNSARSIPWC